MSQKILSIREERRYEAQLSLESIGKIGQEKLKTASVLVIGAGGKGTTALENLITVGIGSIGISDDSLVKEETLCRQNLYGDNDIGKQKAIVTKQYLQSRNQFTNIKIHNIRLNAENLKTIIKNYDVLLDATNNFETHFAIAEAANEANIPLVFGTIIKNKSIITILNTGKGKKLIDIFPDKKPINVGEEEVSTPIVIINSITGTLLANETIKLILGNPSQLINNLLIINPADYTLELQPI